MLGNPLAPRKMNRPPRLAAFAARLVCTAALMAGAGSAWAVCNIEPFSNENIGRRVESLRQTCVGPELRWGVEVPRVNVMRTRVDSNFAQKLSPSLETALRLHWVGRHDEMRGSMRTEQAFVASALRWRPDARIAFNLRVGQELFGAFRERMAVSSVWQPHRRTVMFAEWATTQQGTEWHQVGLRWWLVSRRLSLEAGGLYRPHGAGWTDEHIRLMLELRP